MHRHELTEDEWARLQPLLPPAEGARGRPAMPMRTFLNAVLFIAKTGAPWRDLPIRKERRLVENFFCKLKQYRRVATRYEKTAINFLGFAILASIRIWLA